MTLSPHKGPVNSGARIRHQVGLFLLLQPGSVTRSTLPEQPGSPGSPGEETWAQLRGVQVQPLPLYFQSNTPTAHLRPGVSCCTQTNGFLGGRKPQLVAFANFLGANTPTMAYFRLPT